MKRFVIYLAGMLLVSSARGTGEAVWQWAVPSGESRAYLWIPERCGKVRAVLFAQHNMIERSILEHPEMRRSLAESGMAAVFVYPSMDAVFRFDEGAGERFDSMMKALAETSGYQELATAPVAPLGHSAHASFPWNFAAWNPGRTLAVMSVKGDAPLSDLTGSGKPNPDWGDTGLDGVPGLMVMSEQEWWEARLAPYQRFRAAHPGTPLALLADAGHGHFDATDPLVRFLAMFLRKAAAARLPEDGAGPLRVVDPQAGWLADRWRIGEPPLEAAAPFATYRGERDEAFWCFDREMAVETERYQAWGRGGKSQQAGFIQDGKLVPISNSHAGTELRFMPGADGLTFTLGAGFINPLPPNPPVATKDKRPQEFTVVPQAATAPDHAAGALELSVVLGPVVKTGANTFRVAPDWMFPDLDRKPADAWFLALHPGDASFKGAVRQARMRIAGSTDGEPQVIRFPEIADQSPNGGTFKLGAVSDSGLPVGYFVREGPAVVRGYTLQPTTLPPRAKFPVKVTVVAWQLGGGSGRKFRAATPVERTFSIKP